MFDCFSPDFSNNLRFMHEIDAPVSINAGVLVFPNETSTVFLSRGAIKVTVSCLLCLTSVLDKVSGAISYC